MNTREIVKGVNLHYLNTNKFQTQTLSIKFTQKITKENAGKTAIIPYVLLQGSKKYSTSTILQCKLKELYGAKIVPQVTKKGEYQTISLNCNFINHSYADGQNLLNEVYEILMELIFSPLVNSSKFDENIVKAEKNNLIDLIKSQKNDKIVYANIRMFENMCKNENYSLCRFGTEETVETITSENLYEFYINFLNTARIDISYIGSENPKDLDFKQFTEREMFKKVEKEDYENINVNEIIETMNVTQGKLSIGFRTNTISTDKDYPALLLCNTIFGGSTGSKLFRNVREKMSLCYYASSGVEKFKGVMSVNSGIENKDFDIAKNAILREFSDIQKGEITADEMESAKFTIVNNLKSMQDDQNAVLDYYFGNNLVNCDVNIDDLMKSVEKVSINEVVEVAKKIKLDTVYFLKGEANENV